MMEQFSFLLGNWGMEYNIPKSVLSEAATGMGKGTFKKVLDDRYVTFDYSTLINEQKGQAYGIFAWDRKLETHRFWWFESSGNFSTATCKFINDDTLFMNWHDSLLIQTFKKVNPNKIILRMENPDSDGNFKLVMEVTFNRK